MNRNVNTVVSLKSIKGTSFVGIQNYKSKTEEVSNYLVLVGADYLKAKAKDIETLINCDLKDFNTFDDETYIEAREKLLNGLKKPSKRSSPYESLGNGLKYNSIDKTVHVEGFLQRKTVIKETDKPVKKVNSKPLTLAKNELKSVLNLRIGKYRSFKVGSSETIKTNGFSI